MRDTRRRSMFEDERTDDYTGGYGGSEYGRRDYGREPGRQDYPSSESSDRGFRQPSSGERPEWERGFGRTYGQREFGRENERSGSGEREFERGYGGQQPQQQGRAFGGGTDYGYRRDERDFTGRGPRNFKRSDDRIKEEACEVLTRERFVDASNVDIEVRDAIVYLRGAVDDREQKRRAEDVVDNITGVHEVRNELRVAQRGGGSWGDDQGWRTTAMSGGAAGTPTTREQLQPRRSETGEQLTVVGVFRDMGMAERAINELKAIGFTREDLSFVTRERGASIANASGTTGAETKGGTTGAILGGLGGGALGWMLGVGALAIPGVGPVIAAGALATTIAGAAAGAVAGGFVGALVGAGIPENEAKDYEKDIKEGRVLVTVNCVNDEEKDRAKQVLHKLEADKVKDFRGDKRELTGSNTGNGQRDRQTTTVR